MALTSDLIFANGVDGETGDYLLPPMPPSEIALIAQGKRPADDEHQTDLKYKHQQANEVHLGLAEGHDPNDLAEAGWGVIFAHDADSAVIKAMSKLLDHRKGQAGARYKEYKEESGFRPGDSNRTFLGRQQAGPGSVDPTKVPYYLLIVGSPETIPYRFQYQLDVQYAVGRLCFDTPAEYAQYAESVVAAETQAVARPHQAVLFGVENDDDKATALSTEYLMKPLAEGLKNPPADWTINRIKPQNATKATLAELLGPKNAPALLLTASHGMGFPNGNPLQRDTQGALLCQDWPGPVAWRKPIPKDYYFAGSDLLPDADLHGMIAVHFACYSLGTPKLNNFPNPQATLQTDIAPYDFVARLPQRLLAHSNGGALAVIGHMERAWSQSFAWGTDSQITVFSNLFKRLMKGDRIGYAIESFNERYAELSVDLTSMLEDIKFGAKADEVALSGMWIANNDARNYAILGDPAVRLN